jgi:hypothetical protein
MKRIVSLCALALPTLAMAHDGHYHFFNEVAHHLTEICLVATVGLVSYGIYRRRKAGEETR